jgi:hypothetical protein
LPEINSRKGENIIERGGQSISDLIPHKIKQACLRLTHAMQKLHLCFLICLLACAPLLLFAQTTLGDKGIPEEKVHASNDRAHKPSKERDYKIKRVKTKHTPEYEFYARVEEAAKEKQRILKKMATPQYSNPLYFGHKRPPKRHEAHKMKYCKECGIRH